MSDQPDKPTPETEGDTAPEAQQDAPEQAPMRVVDLGREDELVTWNEWLHRTAKVMTQAAQASEDITGAPAFRVVLKDKRAFAVTHVYSQVSRGKCYITPGRWSNDTSSGEPVCNVITGYLLVGRDERGMPVTVGVPPTMIASVESVLLPEEPEAFGFARFRSDHQPQIEEVDDDNPGLFDDVEPRFAAEK